jgi:phosphoenolpyruvate-protein kinase (PTS system EI component)
MIETAEAAAAVASIAAAADFVSIGTNDLTASVLGSARAGADRGLEPAVVDAVRSIVAGARAHGREVTVCGELAAHPEGARVLVSLGVSALSVAVPAFERVLEIVCAPEGAPR